MIFCVEDDSNIRELVIYTLETTGFKARGFEDGKEFLEALALETPELILLDIMLPGMDGLSVLKKLRKDGLSTPVILLTAKSEIDDIITGLDAGSDDYLPKPFSTGELLARIRALSRRSDSYTGEVLSYHGLSFDKGSMELSAGKNSIRLGPKEGQLIELFLRSPGQILPKDLLIEKVWGIESEAEYNNIEVYISFLRQKLSSLEASAQIHTVRGVGYQLETEK